MTRTINYLVVHCTATQMDSTVVAIQRYWRENLGWKNPGYHYLIDQHGEVHQLATHDRIVNGVKGYNQESIHVSYIGGVTRNNVPFDTRTLEQRKSLRTILHLLKIQYPEATILGHRDFPGVTKACPSFNAIEEYRYA